MHNYVGSYIMFSAHRRFQMFDRAFPHMRIVLVMTASIALFTTAAQGLTSTANCVPFPATFPNGAGGPTPVSCPPFSGGAGAILNSATLSYSADYQFGGTTGTNQVNVSFTPAGPAGVTWTPSSTTVTVSGGASSGAIQTASATATGGVTAANFAAAFNVNISSAVTQGTVATSSGAVAVTYDFNPAPPPSPPTSTCDASVPVFAAQGPRDAFQTHYASNLNIGDSFVNITNAGSAIAPAGGTPGDGNICVHVYTFSPDEQEVSCCSCLVTTNALVSLSVNNDLVSNTLTPARPTSVVVKLVATVGA